MDKEVVIVSEGLPIGFFGRTEFSLRNAQEALRKYVKYGIIMDMIKSQKVDG